MASKITKRSIMHPAHIALMGITAAALTLVSIHNYNQISTTLPAAQQFAALLGLIVIDLATVTWEALLLSHCESQAERFVCYIGICANLVATTVSYFADSFRNAGVVSVGFFQTLAIVFTGIVVIGNLTLALIYHASDPHTRDRMAQRERDRKREQDERDLDVEREEILMKHRREALLSAAHEAAPDIAAHEKQLYLAKLYGQTASSRPEVLGDTVQLYAPADGGSDTPAPATKRPKP